MVTKIATFCYIPDLSKEVRFLRHVQSFTRKLPLFVTTDGDIVNDASGLTVLKIPKLGPFENTNYNRFNRPADRYAFWAFVHSLRLALEHGFQWFIVLETDCRIAVNDWDLAMSYALNRVPGPLVGGTPVCWHPWSSGQEWSRRLVEFAYAYQREAGVPMAFEGAHAGAWPLTLYPNGALAIYNTSVLAPFFRESLAELSTPGKLDREAHAVRALAFDLYIGRSLVEAYGLSLLDRFAWCTRSYSGCENHHIGYGERFDMLQRKTKVAVHQIKTPVYDFNI